MTSLAATIYNIKNIDDRTTYIYTKIKRKKSEADVIYIYIKKKNVSSILSKTIFWEVFT